MSNQLTLNYYQQRAKDTAIYPGQKSTQGILYTALGLAGEAGETADQVKKILRDDNGVLTPERRDKLLKELGDVMWYVANLAAELGYTLQYVAEHNIVKLQDRQERGVLSGDGGLR